MLVAVGSVVLAGYAAALMLILVALIAAVLYLRRIGRLLAGRIERGHRRTVAAQTETRAAADDQRRRLEAVQAELTALRGELRSLTEQHGAQLDHLATELDRLHGSRREQVDREHLRLALRRQYGQVDALFALYHEIAPVRAFPPMGTWAASPDLLRHLFTTVTEQRPQLVLECGSGVSTLVMAYALERLGGGRIVALEHLEAHRDATQALLAHHGLAHRVEVRFAPLHDVDIDGTSYPWYDTTQVPDDVVDLVFVDGPPGKLHRHARLPAVVVLHDQLTPGATVMLDDARRPQEREVVAYWSERFPDLTVTEIPHEKGTVVLRRQAEDVAG